MQKRVINAKLVHFTRVVEKVFVIYQWMHVINVITEFGFVLYGYCEIYLVVVFKSVLHMI